MPDEASQESRRSEADSAPRTMSNVQHKQRKNQAAAAALARSLAFHSARKSFISALTLTIRDPTPLYFLMTPVTVLVTAPWLTVPLPEIEENNVKEAFEFKGGFGRKHGHKFFRDVVGGATRED